MRVSLARLLVATLLVFTLLPAAIVAVVLARGSAAAVEQMAGSILAGVADRIQAQTEGHLRAAHAALDGLIPASPSDEQTRQARRWLRELDRLEPMAFALARQSQEVQRVQAANLQGAYRSVESTPAGPRVGERAAGGPARRYYMATQPGDRSRPLPQADVGYEPRNRPWYQAAMRETRRVFTMPTVSSGASGSRQLVVALAQPVYDDDGGAAGVVAVDMHLGELANRLRVQRISAFGAAYIVDEQGMLVASSAGDPLYRVQPAPAAATGGPSQTAAEVVRTSAADSANARIRAAAVALAAARAAGPSDSVAVNTALQRVAADGGNLMLVQRPFGQELGLRWMLVVVAPESDFTGAISQARRTSMWVLGAVLLLGALGAAWVARSIGGRLRRLGVAASQLGRGEVPSIDQTTRISEVAQLSQVLHDSAGQLAAYRAQVQADAVELAQANDQLEARVAQRTAELEASREEALAAARAKAAFLATMSHEIRTPLNGVVGMSALLAETALDAEQRDYLQTIRLSSDQLLAVINDILDFSKIESGKLELEREPLSLRTLVEEACDIAAPRAREKGLELIVDVPEPATGGPPAAILGDVTRLRQVLINLINNAVKFTERGEVAVHARLLPPPADVPGAGALPPGGPAPAHVEFRVSDTGIGIPADRVGSLFEAFTQVDASTTRKFGGTGLGLAICKRLVEMMGGRIGVDSVQGQGSSFWFTVLAPVADLPEPALAPLASVLSQCRVLVVDDHATNVRILTRQLQLWGMQVASAESAPQALGMLASQRLPDIVITDMHMPGMDGLEFTRRLKALPGAADTPVVLLSSGFMPGGDAHAGLFAARLLKPARQNQLFDTLARCLSSDYATQARVAVQRDERRDITVLVADDNAVNLKVACAMLTRLGYDHVTAADGQAAVDQVRDSMLAARPLGAVLMDVNMPRMDGLEATRVIQQEWGVRAPPIIALTAGASAEDRARCEAAGMQDYLTKPLQVAALAQALERWVRPPAVQGAEGAEDAQGAQGPRDAAHAAQPGAPASPGGQVDDGARIDESAWIDESALMDFVRLEEFREFDDAELSMTREVVSLFVQDVPGRIEAIAQALAAGDPARLSRAAHALKGAAGNVGASAISALCAGLEADSRTGAMPADAALRVRRLGVLWPATQAAIERWLATPA